jgi:septal ring factor EnvC (AmiA/AmiB activator)
MNPNMLKAMRAKKTRTVNPDIPRPNLFTHEKQLKEVKLSAEQLQAQIVELQSQVKKLERKLNAQNNYLQALHQRAVMKK